MKTSKQPPKAAKKTATRGATKSAKKNGDSASRPTRGKIAGLEDWRDHLLRRVRELIHEADPEITEERKWKKPSNPAGVPVWSRDGLICTGEIYKDHVKLTFAYGAELKDPAGLFNSGLEGNLRRAIDLREGEEIGESAFQDLVRAAVARNRRA